MREKTDLTEVILQGQLVDYLLATGAFAVPKLYPEVLYRRWDAFQDWYLSAERSPEIREYIANIIVTMFNCTDLRAQLAALEIGWLLHLDEMVGEMQRVVSEGVFDRLSKSVQRTFLIVVAKGRLSELVDFSIRQLLRREELDFWLTSPAIALEDGDPLGVDDLWRIRTVAQYYTDKAGWQERQQIEQASQQWVELQKRVGAPKRLSELLRLFLEEYAQTFPLFSSKVQELLAYLEKDPMS